MIFKSDKLDYLGGPRKEIFFDNFFSIGQGPSNVGKLNWNLLSFFSFIFSIGQCAMVPPVPEKLWLEVGTHIVLN